MLKVAMPLNQLDLAVVITSEIVAYQQRRRPPPTNEAAGSMTSTRCPSFGLTGTRTAAGDVSGSFSPPASCTFSLRANTQREKYH